MENELTIKKTGDLMTALDTQGLGEMLKPLIREIHLFDSYVAGTTHLEDPAILSTIRTGDRLVLRREANKFDDNAILLLAEDGEAGDAMIRPADATSANPAASGKKTGLRKLGYVPEKDNLIFARLMDAGKRLTARISKIEKKGNFTLISIGIYLVDF